jgi:hypothetical protein
VPRKLIAAAIGAAVALTVQSAMAGNYALVIGVNQYQHAFDFPNLSFARPDAETIAGLLVQGSTFSRDCVRLLIDTQATKVRIFQEFRALDDRCNAGGESGSHAVIFFAGHAVSAGGTGSDFAKINSAQSHEFLAPTDANLANTFAMGGGYENETFIKKEEFAAQLVRLRAEDISLIIDACNSDVPDLAQLMQMQGATREEKVALLAASNKEAYEFPELRHGALSYGIIKALETMQKRAPRGTSIDVGMDALYSDVVSIFSTTTVRGKLLIAYNQPRLEKYPNDAGLMRFAALTGSGPVVAVAPPAAPLPTPGLASAPPSPPPASVGTVKFVSPVPPGAYLEVDGSVMPWQPGRSVALPTGAHIVVVGTPHYSYRSVHPVVVAAGATASLTPRFEGSLTVQSVNKADPSQPGPDLQISLDGQLLGTGKTLSQSNIAAGTHKLTVSVFDTTKTSDVTISPTSPLVVRYLAEAIAPQAPKVNVIP